MLLGELIHATLHYRVEGRCRNLRTYELVFQGNELGVMLEDLEESAT